MVFRDVNFFRPTQYNRKDEFSDNNEIGFVRLHSKYIKNTIKSASAQVLISQVLSVENKYDCLKQSAMQEMGGVYTHESHIAYKDVAFLKMERGLYEDSKRRLGAGESRNMLHSLTYEFETELNETRRELEICRVQIATANARIAELESQLADSVSQNVPICSNKGLPAVVCRMRREGCTDEMIAAHLHKGGTWCSHAQVGALLHPDESVTASSSMSQRARRLLGKA